MAEDGEASGAADEAVEELEPHDIKTGIPAMDTATGVALVGELPANTRLRAEAMVRKALDTDPAGIVDAALLADTATRLRSADEEEARRVAAEKAERPDLSVRMGLSVLQGHAKREGVELASGDTKPVILDKINAARTAASSEG